MEILIYEGPFKIPIYQVPFKKPVIICAFENAYIDICHVSHVMSCQRHLGAENNNGQSLAKESQGPDIKKMFLASFLKREIK